MAAAMAEGLEGWVAKIVVVEPSEAACVAAALDAGRPVQIEGALETSAEMLSSGLASAPALAVLQRVAAVAMAVNESELMAAPAFLAAHGGPATTPSGATGLAGLRAAMRDGRFGLDRHSGVLLVVSEAA